MSVTVSCTIGVLHRTVSGEGSISHRACCTRPVEVLAEDLLTEGSDVPG